MSLSSQSCLIAVRCYVFVYVFVQHRGPESFVARAKLERQLIALEKEGAVMKGACFLYHWQNELLTC